MLHLNRSVPHMASIGFLVFALVISACLVFGWCLLVVAQALGLTSGCCGCEDSGECPECLREGAAGFCAVRE